MTTMNSEKSFILVLVTTVFFTVSFIPGSNAQVKLRFTASVEVPSIKCITNPQQFTLDIKNRTICFCIWIQNVVPTWNCLQGDGRAGLDDLKMLMDTLRNFTSMIPTFPSLEGEESSGGEGDMFNPYQLPELPFGDTNFGRNMLPISRDRKNDSKPENEAAEKPAADDDIPSTAQSEKSAPKSQKNSMNPFSDILF